MGLRVELRYATKITQVFSDGGRQLGFKLLGKKTDFYQQKLAELWGVYNNPPYSQYRNYAERHVQSVKRIIKQFAQGKPGVQEEPIERSQLETILIMSALALNNTPYLSEENTHLMALMIKIVSSWLLSIGSPM